MVFLFLIVIIGVVVDQMVKLLILQNVPLNSKMTVINDFFYITNINNKGAAWGMFQGGKWIFAAFTLIFIVILIMLLLKNKSVLNIVATGTIISGAVGNLIDRLLRPDGVVDFLEFHFGSYVFPIFNVADCLIVVGCIAFGIIILTSKNFDYHILKKGQNK